MNQEFGNIVDLNGNTIINVGNPVNGGDAMNKDSVFSNFAKKDSELIATAPTVNINSTGLFNIHSITIPPDPIYGIEGKVRTIRYMFGLSKPNVGSNTFRIEFVSGGYNFFNNNIAIPAPINSAFSGEIVFMQSIRAGTSQMLACKITMYSSTNIFFQVIGQQGAVSSGWDKTISNNILMRINCLTFGTGINFTLRQLETTFI